MKPWRVWLFVFLGALFAFLFFRYSPFEKITSAPTLEAEKSVAVNSTEGPNPEARESYSYYAKSPALKPKVAARAYLVGDLDTGETILAQNEKEGLPIASVTKLMTALVSNELTLSDQVITVSKRAAATEGGNGGLRAGEKIKAGDLLYPLLLESSNDAAEALAEYLGRDAFLAKMNERSRELLMFQTKYVDPSGLSPNNQSTASDLFKLAQHFWKAKNQLLQITTFRSFASPSHFWQSNNQFLRDDGYLGGKSGYTDPARQTVVSLFAAPLANGVERNIGLALLGSSDRVKDVENILKYLKGNIAYGTRPVAQVVEVPIEVGIPTGVGNVVIAPIPEIKEPDYVTLTFGGDIMLDRGVRNSVEKNFGGDYSALFEKLEILKDSDVVFANLEGTASDKGEDLGNLYSFRMDPSVLPALKGAGVSVLSLANNHIGDFGREAFSDTLSRMRENEIFYTGAGENKEEAELPVVIEKYGMKIGFLGFSDKGPASMEAGENRAGILLASDPRFDEIVKRAASFVDYLIVSFHFGEEYQTVHNARQEELAHRAIDNGAKIVVGSHPHVIEDTEVYGNGYIAYSLGNFIFDQGFSEATMQGMLLGVKLYKDGGMTVQKNILKLNKLFQPDKIIFGKEETLLR